MNEEVWGHILDLGRTNRYFTTLYERHRRQRVGLRLAMIAFGGGSAATLLDGTPSILSLLLGIGLAGCSAYDWAVDPGRRAASYHQIARQCTELRAEYLRLWRSLTSLEPEDAEDRLRELEARGRLVDETVAAAEAQLGDDELNERCATAEYTTAEQQYAQA